MPPAVLNLFLMKFSCVLQRILKQRGRRYGILSIVTRKQPIDCKEEPNP